MKLVPRVRVGMNYEDSSKDRFQRCMSLQRNQLMHALVSLGD